MSETAHQDHIEKKAFLVNSSSLKDVRSFCREVFEKLQIQEDLKDELVLAIAEAAQNIVKHAFKNSASPTELMVVQISCENNKLQIAFYDRGTPVDPKKVKHREPYRPFAPIIINQYFDEYFNGKANNLYRYMLGAVSCKEKCLNDAPAIVHFDNTSRVQTINENNV